jgi:hypothetical protein
MTRLLEDDDREIMRDGEVLRVPIYNTGRRRMATGSRRNALGLPRP